MAGIGSVMLARDKASDRSTINRANRANQAQAGKRGFWGGVGRGLLGLAGATIAGPWGAGIGSWLGGTVGRKAAGDYDEIGDTTFYRDDVKQINSSIRETRQNEMTNSIQRAMLDAYTAYAMPQATDWLKTKLGVANPSAVLADETAREGAKRLGLNIEEISGGDGLPVPSGVQRLSLDSVAKPSIDMGQIGQTGSPPLSGDHIVDHVNNLVGPPLPANQFSDQFVSGPYQSSVATNQGPYLQSRKGYVSPVARDQFRMRGILDRAIHNQRGTKYGS